MERRNFLKNSSAAMAGSFIIPTIVPSSVFGKNAPSNKINVAQIGFGRIAMTHDLAETLTFDAARVIAVCDLDSNRVAKGKAFIEGFYAKKTGSKDAVTVKTYGDYREMLLNKDIDAVMISTPDHWHSQPAIEAALAGKDVYLQKPTSLTIAEGQKLVEVIKRKGTIFQVGTQQRAMPQFRIAA
jgi:myo-inositol 2-dehydrogenase/D-chiro-inositol 1-dehydrogenase